MPFFQDVKKAQAARKFVGIKAGNKLCPGALRSYTPLPLRLAESLELLVVKKSQWAQSLVHICC